ncbi:hypothetical protein V2J09_018658 [Rumex salicifolius]
MMTYNGFYVNRYESVKDGPNLRSIQNDMREEYYQDVSYWIAWKAQQCAKDMLRGTPEENYGILPLYCYMIKQVNKGTHTCLALEEHNRFKYVFIAIGASIRGFEVMRKRWFFEKLWHVIPYSPELAHYHCPWPEFSFSFGSALGVQETPQTEPQDNVQRKRDPYIVLQGNLQLHIERF